MNSLVLVTKLNSITNTCSFFPSCNHNCEFISHILPQDILATWSSSQLPADTGQTRVTSPDCPNCQDPVSCYNSGTQLKTIGWGWGNDVLWQCKVLHYDQVTSLRLHLAHKCCSILLKNKYQRILCP